MPPHPSRPVRPCSSIPLPCRAEYLIEFRDNRCTDGRLNHAINKHHLIIARHVDVTITRPVIADRKHLIAASCRGYCISDKGIVGIVLNVSQHFSTIQSVLHSDTRISASVNGNIGSLVWGEGSTDPRLARLRDIPNHVIVKKGNRVITSGYSLFPSGIEIGRVTRTGLKGGDSFLDIEIYLSTDFSKLQYVYVINNLLAEEQKELEAPIKIE